MVSLFKGFIHIAHHIYSHSADKGEIIYPVTPNEHLKGWHGGNFKNSIPGEPIIDINDF